MRNTSVNGNDNVPRSTVGSEMKMYTMSQVLALSNHTDKSLFKAAKDGTFPAPVRIGGRWFFHKEQVDEWVKQNGRYVRVGRGNNGNVETLQAWRAKVKSSFALADEMKVILPRIDEIERMVRELHSALMSTEGK